MRFRKTILAETADLVEHALGEPFSAPPAGGAFPPPLSDLPGIPTDGAFGTVDVARHDIRAAGVRAIFAETSSSAELADALQSPEPEAASNGSASGDLTLADAVDRHLQALFAAHGDEGTHHYWSGPAHKSVDETRAYIADTLALKGAHVWAITEGGGEALGRIALFVLREGVGEIGIIMRPDATGRGLASKGLAAVVEYGFGPLNLHRIAADLHDGPGQDLALALLRMESLAETCSACAAAEGELEESLARLADHVREPATSGQRS